MLRFYCQYSFGGFRTFRIRGVHNEDLVEQEVTNDREMDFPKMGNLYFNYGGAKMLYRTYDNGELAIVLREIPGIERDTDGRQINCSLQIIAPYSEKALMDNIMLEIINTLPRFQQKFVEEFSFRGGLHYSGEFLNELVEKLRDKNYVTESKSLQNFDSRKGSVYLFVPSSPLFMGDKHLQDKVIKDLQLGSNSFECKNTLKNTISPKELEQLFGTVEFSKVSDCAPLTVNPKEISGNDDQEGKDKFENRTDSTDSVNSDVNRVTKDNAAQNCKMSEEDIEALRDEIRKALERQKQMKRIICSLGIGCTAMALGWLLTAILK